MKIKTFLIIFFLFFKSSQLYCQCDDGWFSYRGSVGIVSMHEDIDFQMFFTGFYNFENHFSSGLETGIVFSVPSNLINITPKIKYRFLYNRLLRPFVEVGGGFQFATKNNCNGRTVFSSSYGLEIYTRHRIKYFVKLSSEFYRFKVDSKPKNNFNCGYSLDLGVIF